MENDAITGVTVREGGEEKTYRAARVIDATVDADVAAAAGVPYTFAGEDIGEKDRQMGVTLVFTVNNVDWDKVVDYLENDGNAGTAQTANPPGATPRKATAMCRTIPCSSSEVSMLPVKITAMCSSTP